MHIRTSAIRSAIAGTVAVLAAALALVAFPSTAAAKKRIAVLKFEGVKSKRVRKSVVKMVGRRYQLVSGKKFDKAARRLRARKLSNRNVAKVASALDLDGVLEGKVERDDGDWVFRLRLREGATGKTSRKFTIRMSRPQMKRKTKKKLGKRLFRAIDRLPPLQRDEEEEEEEDDGDWEEGGDEEEDDDDGFVRAGYKETHTDEEDPLGGKKKSTATIEQKSDDDDDGEEGPVSIHKGAGAAGAILDLNAGASFIGRSLTFTSRADLGDLAPRGYEGVMVPGVFLNGEIYPFAGGKTKGAASKLGVGFVVDRSIQFETTVAGATEVRLPTSQARYGAFLLYRHRFGDKASKPVLTLRVGYSKLAFDIDRSAAPADVVIDVPNVGYTYVSPGASLRVPMGKSGATFIAEGSYVAVLDAGEITLAEHYGKATVTGGDAEVAIEYKLAEKFALRFGGRMTMIGYQFAGSGQEAVNRDGDPETVDVGGALDRYLGGYVTVGYRM